MKLQKHANEEEIRRLPLHVKKAAKVCIVERARQMRKLLRDMTTTKARDTAEEACTLFESIIRFLCARARQLGNGENQTVDEGMNELSVGDLELLENYDLLEDAPTMRRRVEWIRLFSVAEKELIVENKLQPTRRRTITHTPETNYAWWDYQEEINLRTKLVTPTDARPGVRKQWGATFDFAAYYHQFELPVALRLWHAKTPLGVKRLKTIPTGSSFCVALAQSFSLCIAAACMERFPSADVTVYIDNMRITADDEGYLRDAVRFVYSLCEQLNVTINESFDETMAQITARRYQFLGVQYDHVAGTTDLSEKARTKLAQIATIKTEHLRGMSLRELISIYGTLMYNSITVSGGQTKDENEKQLAFHCNRASHYWMAKFFRRRASQRAPLEQQAHPWESILPDFSFWARSIMQRPPVCRRDERPDRRVLAYTDASTRGFGFACFWDDGEANHVGGSWKEGELDKHINVLEAMAVLRCLDFLSAHKDAQRMQISLRIDNTATMYSIAKGSSRSFELNLIICRIVTHECFCRIVSADYVRSQDNRADWLSRLGCHHSSVRKF